MDISSGEDQRLQVDKSEQEPLRSDGGTSETGGNRNKAQIYQAQAGQLKDFLDLQSNWFGNINNRTIAVLQFNQAVVAIIVGSFALFEGLQANVYLIATIISFIISLWFCILVYSPEKGQEERSREMSQPSKNTMKTLLESILE